MRTRLTLLLCGAALGCAASDLSVPPVPLAKSIPAASAAEQRWKNLLAAQRSEEESADRKRGGNPKLLLADQAREFYQANRDDVRALEARQIEILALVDAEHDGEISVAKRLEQTVAELRQNKSLPERIRARAVAAFEYRRTFREAKSDIQRFANVEAVAKKMLTEFPASDVGPVALLALASVVEPKEATRLADEILARSQDETMKAAARVIRTRLALLGRPLSAALPAVLRQEVPAGVPWVVYSWSVDAPGSVEFGRMLQARRFQALGVCLDHDTSAAAVVQRGANLGGKHVYDAKGTSGEAARLLALSVPGLVYLTDRHGVIRDVRGTENLESKLKALGFSTPVLLPP